MSKTNPTKSAQALITAPALFRAGWQEYRTHIWRYVGIIGLIAVPANLISLSSTLANDVTVSFYVRLGTLFMASALVWAIVHQRDLIGLSLRRAYYEGSALLLRLILAVIVVAVMLLPAAVGLSLYALGTVNNVGSLAINFILAGLALILALPSLYWMVRFNLVVFTIGDGAWPIAGLRSARALTMGRFWLVARRFVVLVLFMLGILIIPTVALVLLTAVTHLSVFLIVLQLFLSLVVAPLGALYMYGLYRALEGA